ncbi:class I SAM-dependent methyltransferase [Methanogenium cariaci]|uniref:class I SAM-dependent methyltransferase n=1 Tax=Methanogenium cariaci TaxID=2197 RepID=UPI001FDF7CC8|nr:class I SAM-dependent methyltransferase [Methanogenium cariaci]
MIIGMSGIMKGTCIDLGSGPAILSIAVAQQSDLSVIALDYSDDMHKAASRNIEDAGLSSRIGILCGDVHAMPFDDDSADLIISRGGSMFFWDDIHTAFREIYRVLKPGGMTYIGGRVWQQRTAGWDCSCHDQKRTRNGRNLTKRISHLRMQNVFRPCSMK